MERLRTYIRLTKPGVMLGNLLTAAAGYLLAAGTNVDWLNFVLATGGMGLVISAACVINNYLDRDIDSVMKRTKNRPSVLGLVTPAEMIGEGVILLAAGTYILYAYTTLLATILGLAGFVIYVWLYGAWSKRRSIHGTLVGSISGALPIAGGYAAVGGQVDAGLIILFLILFFWQFPEFYSIAIYRFKEYKAAKIPVMPVVVGVRSTVIQIYIYTWLYMLSTLALSVLGYTGVVFMLVMLALNIGWLRIAHEGLRVSDVDSWARRMFRYSMWEILAISIMLAISPYLP